jgi:hypothetical protein
MGQARGAPAAPPEVPAEAVRKFKQLPAAQVQAAYEAWLETAEGKAYMAAHKAWEDGRRSYVGKVASDGTLRVEDVEAGTYMLMVGASDGATGKTEGQVMQQVVVPTAAAGGMGPAVDVGELKLVTK